mgnify:CR=1 FL=1
MLKKFTNPYLKMPTEEELTLAKEFERDCVLIMSDHGHNLRLTMGLIKKKSAIGDRADVLLKNDRYAYKTCTIYTFQHEDLKGGSDYVRTEEKTSIVRSKVSTENINMYRENMKTDTVPTIGEYASHIISKKGFIMVYAISAERAKN